MYVCICNAITDGDIREATTVNGARRTAEVFAACHRRAQCGACVRRLRELMLQAIAAARPPSPP